MTPELAYEIVIFIFIGTMLLSLYRVVTGPTSADRLIGLNIVSAQMLAVLVLIATKEKLHVYLDVALVYDLFGFMGLLAILRFFGKREQM